MTRFLMSSNAAALEAAIAGLSSATVEAEYGDDVVEGSVLTLAHHGPRAGNQAPCLATIAGMEINVVGLSHLDLDSLGGCAAVIGRKPEAPSFWALAAFIDTAGPHKLGQSGASAEDIRRLQAYWAWAEGHKTFAPRDGSVADVTEAVEAGIEVLTRILADDSDLLAAGDAFAAAEEALNKASFIEVIGGVVVRVGDGFVNHLYTAPSGEVCRAVVGLRTDFHSCTVSLADPLPGVSACDIAQSVWGEGAGGNAGIAGSPRGQVMGLDDLVALRDAVIVAIHSPQA